MQLNPLQQAADLIGRSKNVLICLPVQPSSDAIASGLGLFLILEKLGKRSKVVCHDFDLPSNHAFLPKSDAIEKSLKNLRQFIISLDVSKVAVEELSYAIDSGKLNIYVTPKDGFYETRDVSTNAGNFAFDAVVTIGASELEDLGEMTSANAEFFYRTPVLNIDHQAKNSRFGQVNLVDLTAASCAEVVFELAKALGFNVLDEQVATTLLTGIIAKTKSFQTPTVTPRSLAIASHLISSGARREEIIDHLYQSKSIASLKLWGRVLARLQSDHGGRLVWSLLSQQDFEKSGAAETDLPSVIDELIVNIPSAELIVILYSTGASSVTALVAPIKEFDVSSAFPNAKPLGSDALFTWSTGQEDLSKAEEEIKRLAGQLLKAV